MPDLSSIIATVRSSDERTEQACVNSLLQNGVSEGQIHIIKEAPFKRALEVCYETAADSGASWLLTVDADMVLLPEVLEKFYQQALNMPGHFIQIQGQVLDKFYGEIRRGGPRLYRVKYLKKALDISLSLDDHIRPETNIIQKMGSLGHPARYISPAIAIHDFEQYYADIYRKASVYAVKHIDKLPKILKEAVKHREDDPDYQVILKGIYDSLATGMDVKIDKRLFNKEAKEALLELGFHEKESTVKELALEAILINIQKTTKPDFDKGHSKDVPEKKLVLMKKIFEKKGILKGSIYNTGILLDKLGRYMKKS